METHLIEKKGILLINLGSPEKNTTREVRKFLREFLSDPRVIDINPVLRWLLLTFIILPFRPAKSSAAYKKIWSTGVSPLLRHTFILGLRLQGQLDTKYPGRFHVKTAMRYGPRSIKRALRKFERMGIRKITAIPLFPQYSSSTYGSVVEEIYKKAKTFGDSFNISILSPFFSDPGYIASLSRKIGEEMAVFEKKSGTNKRHLIFSFHGVPERHILKSDRNNHCLQKKDCCENPKGAISFCYRAQCMQTVRLLANELGLAVVDYTVVFQSRMGRTKWIGPHLDEVVRSMPHSGFDSLAVVSPSFVTDCLETLEEINIRTRADFLASGGSHFLYISCLNGDARWVESIVELVSK